MAKCEEAEDEGLLVGFKSGKRSAIVPLPSGSYLRLKGCGNYILGFNLQNMVYPPDWKEIRGV